MFRFLFSVFFFVSIVPCLFTLSISYLNSRFNMRQKIRWNLNQNSRITTLFSVAIEDNIALTSSHSSVSIVGSGPSGLSTAIMLARNGFRNITLYDQFPEPPLPDDQSVWGNYESERSYLIGLSGRGQKALTELGAIDRIRNYSTSLLGAILWSPETPIANPDERSFGKRRYVSLCIERDRISSCLVQEIREKYPEEICLRFQTNCTAIHWGKPGHPCTLLLRSTDPSASPESAAEEVETALVVGADGSGSVVRAAIVSHQQQGGEGVKGEKVGKMDRVQVTSFEDKNVRVYRTIPLHMPFGSSPFDPKKGPSSGAGEGGTGTGAGAGAGIKWKQGVNYSARMKSDINLEALPSKDGVYLGVVLFRPWDKRFQSMKTGADARAFFDEVLPMFSACARTADLERFAAKKDSRLPRFQFTGPALHYSVPSKTSSGGFLSCLVGDCIHTVKPYFGLGVNSAFEDVIALQTALRKEKGNFHTALPLYSKIRGKEAKALVETSRTFDGGFFTFVLPLILDAVFHKLLPSVFAANTITLMQSELYTFTEAQARKRRDRGLQALFITGIFAVLFKSVSFSWKYILRRIAAF